MVRYISIPWHSAGLRSSQGSPYADSKKRVLAERKYDNYGRLPSTCITKSERTTGVWTKRDLTDLEREVRGIMRENRSWYFNQAAERFHLPLAEGGPTPVAHKRTRRIDCVSSKLRENRRKEISSSQTADEASSGWMIERAPTRRTLYQIAAKILGQPVNTIATVLPKAAFYRKRQLSSLREALAKKVVHGKYGAQMISENVFLRLSEGRVDSQTCVMVMAAQDVAIRTRAWHARFVGGTDRCRVCGDGRETAEHILAMCQPHQWT